ncbi:MAG: hypothetical protein F4Z93_03395 [Rhodospirillales bacterium]|nr:hypothetical protein [Rhodospirillales bacterium]
MEGLNLRGDPAPAEEPPSEEPLGLDLIRGWLKKPRPRLRRLWLWVPHTAKGIRKVYRWLRANSGPALRRTAETLRKTARVAQALRGAAERLRVRLERTFPPGSRGHAVAGHLAEGSRLLLRSALLLVGIGREADRLPKVWEPERVPGERPPQRERPTPGPRSERATETPDDPGTNEPRASTGAGPASRDDASASPGSAGSPTNEALRRERSPPAPSPPIPSSAEPSPPEPPEPEPSREDPPATGSAEPAPADTSPVRGVPPGPRADALAKLSKSLRGQILKLGKRPRKAWLRYTVWRILNECGEQTSDDLGLLLEMDPDNLVKRHLSPLVEEGAVQRTIPERINHPKQAYRSTRFPPGAHRPPSGSQ